MFTPSGEINDPSGVFTIQVLGSQLLDSGTEENNGQGAAFSDIGGSPTDTNDGVGPAGDLSEFLGSGTPSGLTISDLISPNDVVATITISQVPEPSSLLMLATLAGMVGISTRRRRMDG